MYRVKDMIAFLNKIFCSPDFSVKNPKKSDFFSKKGLIIFSGSGWSNASGHVTLWNGVSCSDDCHFMGSPENGTFIPEVAYIWELK